MRFVLALTAVILQLALSTGAPSTHHENRRSYYAGQRPVTPEATHQCLNFTHSFCNSAGYTTALFPNNRSQNFSQAASEFAHFQRLLETRCSDKLGTLLCFYYFPFCDQRQWQDTTARNQPKPILPCRETCQEARNSCETLLQGQGFSWPAQFDCSENYFLPASSMRCANGTLTVSISGSTREVPEPTPTTPSSTKIPTSTPQVEAPCQPNNSECSPSGTKQPTEEPTEEPSAEPSTEMPTVAECTCPRCDVRSTCTSNTFRRNSYTYAARVTVVSKQTVNNTRTYTVNVVKQYTLKSEKNGALSPAPSMAHQVVLQANPECCDSCPNLEINREYMIAGHFENSPSLKWLLRSHDSLVSTWKAKYGKKMEKWIERGNTYRLGQLQNGIGQ